MTNVTRISWTIKTGNQWWSGTNSKVRIEIYRDDQLLKSLNLEPSKTPRLDKGELVAYGWIFQHPEARLGNAFSGEPVPYYEEFPQGVRGHLKVKFITRGKDAWEIDWISSTVFSGNISTIGLGQPGSFVWFEDCEVFRFKDLPSVLSTDQSEGSTSLTLDYTDKLFGV